MKSLLLEDKLTQTPHVGTILAIVQAKRVISFGFTICFQMKDIQLKHLPPHIMRTLAQMENDFILCVGFIQWKVFMQNQRFVGRGCHRHFMHFIIRSKGVYGHKIMTSYLYSIISM